MARSKKTADAAAEAVENEAVETAAEPEVIIKEEEEVIDGEVVGGNAETKDSGSDGGSTVCICSNYPFDIKYKVPDAGGRPRDIIIKGNAQELKGKPKGILPVGAFGITTGVPKEAWEWILKHRPDEPAIKNGNVFAVSANKARAAARERSSVRHGFEPIEPKKA